MVSSVINRSGVVRAGDFTRTNEYLFFVSLARTGSFLSGAVMSKVFDGLVCADLRTHHVGTGPSRGLINSIRSTYGSQICKLSTLRLY